MAVKRVVTTIAARHLDAAKSCNPMGRLVNILSHA